MTPAPPTPDSDRLGSTRIDSDRLKNPSSAGRLGRSLWPIAGRPAGRPASRRNRRVVRYRHCLRADAKRSGSRPGAARGPDRAARPDLEAVAPPDAGPVAAVRPPHLPAGRRSAQRQGRAAGRGGAGRGGAADGMGAREPRAYACVQRVPMAVSTASSHRESATVTQAGSSCSTSRQVDWSGGRLSESGAHLRPGPAAGCSASGRKVLLKTRMRCEHGPVCKKNAGRQRCRTSVLCGGVAPLRELISR